MVSPQNAETLRVTAAALQTEAGWCESLAATLASNVSPTSMESSRLSSAAAVAAVNTQVAAANANCMARMQATAAKLANAASTYAAHETEAAARMQAVAPPTVC